MFNLVVIGWSAALWASGFSMAAVAVGWAVGTLLGGLAQLLTQLPSLRSEGWRFRPLWAPKDPDVRRIAALMAPATVGLAAVHINIFVSNIFASRDPGAVSWLNYAFRILYLPIGVFGVALGTTAGAGLARRAAENDMSGLRATLRQALRMLGFLTIPATVGLVLLRVPIVRLLYQRGRFAPHDTEQTAAALALLSIGLVAYSGVKVLAPAFYALGVSHLPAVGSALAVVTNLAVILLLYTHMGFTSVALGTSLGAVASAAWLLAQFERRFGGLRGHGIAAALARMGLASAAMAGVSWGVLRWTEAWMGTRGLGAQIVTGLGPVLAGVASYFLAGRVLGLAEVRRLSRLARTNGGSDPAD
jgi:putative peptidoglycan lipid II flippase